VENLLNSTLQSPSPATRQQPEQTKSQSAGRLNAAPSRLDELEPVAVVDIGSNSVRLVVYEGLTRSPTPIFNEKVLCGLGRHVASLGRLEETSVTMAIESITRFRALARQIGVGAIHVIATAAVREASNGAAFVERVEEIIGAPIRVLTGHEEASLSAFGVVAGFKDPDGIAGDLGGGSFEAIDVKGRTIGTGETLPLGGLRLRDLAGQSIKKAERIVAQSIETSRVLGGGKGRDFFAIGGTFRSLVRLHMAQTDYPLHIMHGYQMPAADAIEFTRMVRRSRPETLPHIDAVSSARRELLPYGAMVLEQALRRSQAKRLVISALGVREGLLYTLLDETMQQSDPLIAACLELSYLRSRSPRFARELCDWTDQFYASAGIEETDEERRLRHAACLLGDIGWRSHPDYRGEQSLSAIAYASFTGIDHPGRAFLALTVFHRYVGLSGDGLSPRIGVLANGRTGERARLLSGALRVAYLISGAMPGVIDRAALKADGEALVLTLPGDLASLAGSRVASRLKQLARLIGLRPEIETPA